MKTKVKVVSGLPLIMIFCVLIALFAAACGGKPGGNTNTTSPNKNMANVLANAPQGATPPNMLGSPTATVTLEEFADFQCPSCGDKFPVMKQIQSIYGSRIK